MSRQIQKFSNRLPLITSSENPLNLISTFEQYSDETMRMKFKWFLVFDLKEF